MTADDVRLSPLRVARAVSPDLQPLDCGYGLERMPCARLRAAAADGLRSDPHPLA